MPYIKLMEKFKAHGNPILGSLLQISRKPRSQAGRHIDLDVHQVASLIDDRTKKPYTKNTIRSSRHTILNFLPRQLFAQFSKFANFYFLCVSIVQLQPSVSTTGRYTTLIPLLIFVGFSMFREALDDLRRARLDEEENNRIASVFRAPKSVSQSEESGLGIADLWVDVKWSDIKVGNILRIQSDHAIPADIALLHVNSANDLAYIDTMALDGETSLKSRQAASLLATNCGHIEGLCDTKAHFVVEDPNFDLYNFEGKVTVSGDVVPLTNNEIIYRGSVLRNTREIWGMVMYTGEECKIRLNATKNPRVKAPALQAMVNKVVLLMACLVIILSISTTAAGDVWQRRVDDQAFYLSHARVGFFQLLASYFLMFNPLIPLALYISLEFVKIVQSQTMNDIDMYDEHSDTPMEPRTAAIHEDLGQVSYVFSDKTGTLTENTMRLRRISVAGTAWVHDVDLRENFPSGCQENEVVDGKQTQSPANTTRNGDKIAIASISEEIQPATQGNASNEVNGELNRKYCQGDNTEDLFAYIQKKPHTAFARQVHFFLLSIAVCHTCVPEKDVHGKISFQAASPDEIALVKAAEELGYLVFDRQSHRITIRTYPDGTEANPVYNIYEILNVIEFSAARRRMSIILRMPDQRICVICKGADTVVQRLLKLSGLAREKTAAVEQKSSRRKTIEAQQARGGPRPARSGASFIRHSLRRARRPPVRGDVEHWLKELGSDSQAPPTDVKHSSQSTRPLDPGESLDASAYPAPVHFEQMMELTEDAAVADDNAVFERCFQHINDFALEGLRTLLYAYRYVDEADYADWRKAYQEATASLVDRQLLVEQVADQLEQDLELIGATAVEDKLQKGVPEAMDKLRRANIKLWMLTGDKRETAISVSYSSHLVKDFSTMLVLEDNVETIEQSISGAIDDIRTLGMAHSVVVVEGQTLSTIETRPGLRDLFIDLVILADSVICCRASPGQKASLVRSIRRRLPRTITLAIGDGANDIAMIQEAHVGIGITGREGLQAARISDYSIAQFRFLVQLLLVHGRWNYVRTCKYVLGTFYKEALLYITQACYQHWNGHTGISLYESSALTAFQPLFSCLPVVFMGIVERDLAPTTLLAVPELYSLGQFNDGFNLRLCLGWVFMAATDAVITFFLMLYLYGPALSTHDDNQDLYAMGTLTFTACIVLICFKIQVLELHNKTISAAVAGLLSIAVWFVFNLGLSATYSDNTIYNVKNGMLLRFGRDPQWWLTLIAVLVAVPAYELAVSSACAVLWPTDVDVWREYEKIPAVRERFRAAAEKELGIGSSGRGSREGKEEGLRNRGRPQGFKKYWTRQRDQ